MTQVPLLFSVTSFIRITLLCKTKLLGLKKQRVDSETFTISSNLFIAISTPMDVYAVECKQLVFAL